MSPVDPADGGIQADSVTGADAGLSAPVPAYVVPGNGRGIALGIIAVVVAIHALEWARGFAISLLLGILFAYTLYPVVAWLGKLRVPWVIGSIVVMTAVVSGLAFGTWSLRGQVQTILDQVPAAVSELSDGIADMREGSDSTMQKVQAAASEIEKATSSDAGTGTSSRRGPTRVVIDRPAFELGDFLLVGSMGAVGLAAQASMVMFLTFFLLLSGDTFKRKLVRLSGPLLAHRRIAVHILDDINASIQRYMFMLLVTNVLVGLLTWIALRLMGLENAGAWAVAAGLLHVIPYFGPAVTAAGIGMAALLQFDSLSAALLVSGASLAIATFVGTFVTTWMTGRIARMNTAAVFVSILFWAWLWGIWGMLLSIPITVIVKVVAQHVEPLEAVAELLGD